MVKKGVPKFDSEGHAEKTPKQMRNELLFSCRIHPDFPGGDGDCAAAVNSAYERAQNGDDSELRELYEAVLSGDVIVIEGGKAHHNVQETARAQDEAREAIDPLKAYELLYKSFYIIRENFDSYFSIDGAEMSDEAAEQLDTMSEQLGDAYPHLQKVDHQLHRITAELVALHKTNAKSKKELQTMIEQIESPAAKHIEDMTELAIQVLEATDNQEMEAYMDQLEAAMKELEVFVSKICKQLILERIMLMEDDAVQDTHQDDTEDYMAYYDDDDLEEDEPAKKRKAASKKTQQAVVQDEDLAVIAGSDFDDEGPLITPELLTQAVEREEIQFWNHLINSGIVRGKIVMKGGVPVLEGARPDLPWFGVTSREEFFKRNIAHNNDYPDYFRHKKINGTYYPEAVFLDESGEALKAYATKDPAIWEAYKKSSIFYMRYKKKRETMGHRLDASVGEQDFDMTG